MPIPANPGQQLYANPEDFISILRTDPGNKLIVNLLPNDALAMIPLVQDIEEFEGFDSSSVRCVLVLGWEDDANASRSDVPYMPSFILSLPELSPSLRNIKDLTFLPGFNNPTLAILFQPLPTATGRTSTPQDTFHLEIRTLDPLAQTYPLISSVPNLPSDSQYLVPCPQSVGGVLLVTATALIHVDQSGKFVTTSTNGWFRFTSAITPTLKREECRLELDGSRVVWADEGNFLVLLRGGGVVQARLQVEGRSVVGIDLVAPKGALESGEGVALDLGLNQPSAVCEVPHTAADGSVQNAFFAASAVGDSHLVSISMVPEETTAAETTAKDEMDVDLDDGMSCFSIFHVSSPTDSFFHLRQTSMEIQSSDPN
jgi:cleavage and polyadenylation specificity factor subunit 1